MTHTDRPGESRHDHARFVRLWTASSRKIHAYLLTLVSRRADAEDLLQDVGVVAWEKFHEFDPDRDFLAWARGIARLKAIAHLRKTKRFGQASSELIDQLHEQTVAMGDLLQLQHEALQACLERLSRKDRELLRHRYAAERTVQEISEQTGRTVAALYKALQRIHERLFACVQERLGRGAIA